MAADVSEVAETRKKIQIKQQVENLRLNARRTVNLGPLAHKAIAQQALVDWVNEWEASLDVACCWHTAEHLRNQQCGWDEQWLQRHLSTYFNKLVKRIYSHIPTSKRPNISRFITLEHTDGVGWHAHGTVTTPAHMTRNEFTAILRELWIKQMQSARNGALGERLFWCQQRAAGYHHYMLKEAAQKDPHLSGRQTATVDLRNTRRP